MIYISKFKNINKTNVSTAGGKGASLGEMTQAGIPVPPGFVILASAFDRFVEETHINLEIATNLKAVKPNDIHSVEKVSSILQDIIHDTPMLDDFSAEIVQAFEQLNAEYVAVRSSATAEDGEIASWAGELDTFLNTTRENVVENVKKCWASLFTPRAIFYRHEKGLIDAQVSVAVVVQQMVQSEVSGIAFTVHPVTEDYDQMIIEAGFGLGEAIVSGQITPDSYVVSKSDMSILDINIGNQNRKLQRTTNNEQTANANEWINMGEEGEKQKLTGKQIIELSELCIKIEKHYGFPCDIEWAFANGKFYITQSRPITTLKKNILEDAVSKKFKFMWGQRQSAMITEAMMEQVTVALNDKVEPINSGVSETMFVSENGIFSHYMPEDSIVEIEKNGISYDSNIYAKNLFQNIDSHIRNFFLFAQKIQTSDLRILSNKELADLFKSYHSFIRKTFHYYATSTPQGTAYIVKKIKDILLSKIDDASVVDDYFVTLSTPTEMDQTMKERLDFLKIVENPDFSEIDFIAYSHSYPALFFNTYKQDVVLEYLRERKSEEQKLNKKTESETKIILASLSDVRRQQEKIYTYLDNSDLQKYSTILQHSGLDRYRLKHVWSGGEYACLNLILEIQNRMNISFDDFIKTYLFSDIFKFFDSGEVLSSSDIAKRKKCFVLHYYDNIVHFFVGEDAVERKNKCAGIKNLSIDSSDFVRGDIANKGIVRGKVKVVLVDDLSQFVLDLQSFERGSILVTTMTSPVMIPILEKSSAIVTDEGGITSHAAISAREFGIPCIVGTHGATKFFQDGDTVEVDADQGVIKKL